MDWGSVSIIISIISAIIVVATFIHNFTKDAKADVQNSTLRFDSLSESIMRANVKLDGISLTTTETRNDVKALDNKINDMDKRVTIVERDLKTAFHRIDEINQK